MKRKKIERENRRINRVTVTCVVIGVFISLIQFLKPEPKPQVIIHKHYHYYQAPQTKQEEKKIEKNKNEIRPSGRS